MAANQNEFILFVHGNDWGKGLSPREIQDAMHRFSIWMEDLANQGILKASQPLADSGKLVSGKSTRVVADGPFAESKEAIGGYWLVQVDTLEDAVEIAKGNPMIDYGAVIEVRPVLEKCLLMEMVLAQEAREAAIEYEPTAV